MPTVTLDQWMRTCPELRDADLGKLVEDRRTGVAPVTQQAVSLWRHGRRMPGPAYIARITQLSGGRVTEADFKAMQKART